MIETNPPLQHGNCPECGVSLDGGGIWQHFYDKARAGGMFDEEAQREADRIAENCGANRDKGRWGRKLIQIVNDRAVSATCPDCKAQWQ